MISNTEQNINLHLCFWKRIVSASETHRCYTPQCCRICVSREISVPQKWLRSTRGWWLMGVSTVVILCAQEIGPMIVCASHWRYALICSVKCHFLSSMLPSGEEEVRAVLGKRVWLLELTTSLQWVHKSGGVFVPAFILAAHQPDRLAHHQQAKGSLLGQDGASTTI